MPIINYLVRVACITYNHAPYIEDAMNGFCMQETSFPFICNIIDDFSTDGEPNIIKRYMVDNFDLSNELVVRKEETEDYQMVFAQHKSNHNCYFAVYFLKYNHFKIKKSKLPYTMEWRNKVKYFAFCEGDDYWIYKNKLQEQVEYMEAHESCALVHSKALVYDDSLKKITTQTKGRDFSTFTDLLRSNKIVSLTVCVRAAIYNDYIKNSSSWQEKKEWKMGDYPCWLWISKKHDIHFIDKVTGVYRILAESASHSQKVEKMLDFLKCNFQIQMFFANLYSIGENDKNNLFYDYIKERIRVLCQFEKYKEAYLEAKSLRYKDRIRFTLFTLLKHIKK